MLLLLVAAGFVFVRFASSQASVSVIGLVRENNAVQWASLQPRVGAGTTCAKCHADVDMQWSRSAHAGQTCESCHGPADRHMEFGAIMGPMAELCNTCHEQVPGRPGYFPTVSRLDHFPLQACTTCHDPHSPAAAFPKIPHMSRAGRIAARVSVTGIAELPPNHNKPPVELCLGCHKPKGGG
jgi:hypothetical protein